MAWCEVGLPCHAVRAAGTGSVELILDECWSSASTWTGGGSHKCSSECWLRSRCVQYPNLPLILDILKTYLCTFTTEYVFLTVQSYHFLLHFLLSPSECSVYVCQPCSLLLFVAVFAHVCMCAGLWSVDTGDFQALVSSFNHTNDAADGKHPAKLCKFHFVLSREG